MVVNYSLCDLFSLLLQLCVTVDPLYFFLLGFFFGYDIDELLVFLVDEKHHFFLQFLIH